MTIADVAIVFAIFIAYFGIALILGSVIGRLFRYGQEPQYLDPRIEQADRWYKEIS